MKLIDHVEQIKVYIKKNYMYANASHLYCKCRCGGVRRFNKDGILESTCDTCRVLGVDKLWLIAKI